MRIKHMLRALGFVLSVMVATTNLATTVYAAEPVIVEEELPDDVIKDNPVEEQPELGDDVSDDDIEAVVEEPEEVVEEEGADPVEPVVEENVTTEEVNEDVTSEENEESIPVTTLGSAEEVTAYLEQHPSNGTRLVLYSETAVNDFYGAVEAVSYDGLWMITYSDNEACNRAYESYMAIGYEVDLDSAVDNHEDDELIEDLTPEDVPEESVEVQTEDTKDVIEEEALSIEKDVVVAIIDTGVDVEDELLKERLVEGISEEMADANGHGTVMAEIVASQTGENVKILPIAAFDENGKSTVAKVYFAIEDAIRADVDVINISASGLGESKVLTHAVADAKNAGIPVIVAAGNDAADTKDYMPGNVLDAITISATDKEQAFAEYSNFGENVDFSAIGILVKDMGTEDEADDLVYMGTSISSAYVSSYAALLISEYKGEEFDVDVFESFLASSIDLGDEGYDVYYGNGFLDKEHIVAVIKEKREALEGEEEDITEELEEEGDMELDTAYYLYRNGSETWGGITSACYLMIGQTTVNGGTIAGDNGGYSHLHIGCNTSAPANAISQLQKCGEASGNRWREGTAVYSRNPADKCVINNVTFYNCWIEMFFDVDYNNCTFYNCTFSNNGGQNIIRFNYCNINPTGYVPGGPTQANPNGPRDYVYAGILGGNNTHWVLNGTTLNGTGAIAAVSNCVQSANPASTDIINGSRVYGATYGVDAWQWYSTNQTIRIDSSSVVEGNSVGIYNTGNLTVQNGYVRNNGNCGIENAGTATINGGTMTGNGVGVRNGGTLAVNGGEIVSNTKGVINAGAFTQAGGNIYRNSGNGIENSNSYTKTGGFLSENGGWGLLNTATANIVSAQVKDNKAGGVYQGGTLYMSGNGAVDNGNYIHLTPGHVVTVNGPLNGSSVGTLNTSAGDRKTGRQLIQLYAADTTVGENIANKYILAFEQNDNEHTQDTYGESGDRAASKGEHIESLIRTGYGTDQNAATNQVILSGVYYAGYESNIEALDGMKITIPFRGNKLRYGEKYLPDTPSHAYTTGEINDPTVTVTMKDGSTKDITKSLCFKGWALDANEMDESKIFTTDQVLAMYGDFHWYAIWDARFDVYFNGNKQNTGENYRVDDLNLWQPLPGNVGPNGDKKNYFTKEDVYKASEKTWYDENREEYVDLTIPYSYQGWSLRDDAKYNDSDVVNPKDESKDTMGEALGIGNYSTGVKWLIEKIKDEETMGFDDDGRAIVPMYVVWDKAPVIEAYDIYVTPKDIDSMSDDNLWKNVTATDREDGTLKNKVDVTLIDFNPDDLKDIKGDRGGVSITYRAEDGAGNVTFYDVMINVISNRAVTSWTTNEDGSRRDTANYVRFIDRENYNKSSMKDGGMEEHSVWYTNPEYVEEITQAFDHLDNKTSIVSYKLDLKTMQNIQAYNKAHFGEVLETSFRTNFYEQFCEPNVISGSLPTHEMARE